MPASTRDFSVDELNETARKRFVKMVEWDEDRNACHLWKGTVSSSGYGSFRIAMGVPAVAAHRVAYVLAHGRIPAGMAIDHDQRVCSSRLCVNRRHLRLLTNEENARDNRHAQRNNPDYIPGDLSTLRVKS